MDSKQIKQEILDACQAAGEGDVISVTAENLLLAFGETVTKKPKPKKGSTDDGKNDVQRS